MAMYQDEVTGQSYDDNSSDTLEAAKASKLKYLKNAGQAATLSGVDQRPSTPAPIQPTASPQPIDPYQNAAQVLTGQPSLVAQQQGMAKGGEVKSGKFRKDLNANVSDEDYAKHQAAMSQAQKIIAHAKSVGFDQRARAGNAQHNAQMAARQAAVQRLAGPQVPMASPQASMPPPQAPTTSMWSGGTAGGPTSMSDGSDGQVHKSMAQRQNEDIQVLDPNTNEVKRTVLKYHSDPDAEQETSPSPTPEPSPSPSPQKEYEDDPSKGIIPRVKDYADAVENKAGEETPGYAQGGMIRKKYPKHPPVDNPAQVPGIQEEQQRTSKLDALKKMKKTPKI